MDDISKRLLRKELDLVEIQYLTFEMPTFSLFPPKELQLLEPKAHISIKNQQNLVNCFFFMYLFLLFTCSKNDFNNSASTSRAEE